MENFSRRLVEHIKQDFYAMMMASNMPAGCMRKANGKLGADRIEKGWGYEYRINVNHAVGILIADNEFVLSHLDRELAGGDETADSPGTIEPRSTEERLFEKTSFSS